MNKTNIGVIRGNQRLTFNFREFPRIIPQTLTIYGEKEVKKHWKSPKPIFNVDTKLSRVALMNESQRPRKFKMAVLAFFANKFRTKNVSDII